jgi:hypothetical protein
MEEGGEEEVGREEGEEGRACWRRPNLGRYCPGRGCERQRLYWRGRWLRRAEGTPARRQEEEATRAAATRFFLYSGMRGKESFVLSCFSFFACVFACVGSRRRISAEIISWPRPGGGKNSVYIYAMIAKRSNAI